MDDLKPLCGRYVGVPRLYRGMTPAGWDCWGLVHYVATHDLGLDWPDYAEAYARAQNGSNEATALAVALCIGSWRLTDPKPGTVACFDRRGMRRNGPPQIFHVGLIISAREMLHVTEATDTVIEPFNGFVWGRYFAGARAFTPESCPHAC